VSGAWWELPTRWQRWVAFWDQREHPRAIGLARILLGSVILADFLQIWRLGLVLAIFGTQQVGGLSDAVVRADIPWFYRIFPPTESSAWLLYLALCTLAFLFTIGAYTRFSAFALMILWAQQAMILPPSDRGIDMLCRDLLCIFMFSSAGFWVGVDGWLARAQGRSTDLVPAWPRYLMILQLVVMYWTAGVQKVGLEWLPMGHFSALYVILQDPAIATHDFSWLGRQPFYFVTQVATAITLLWQWFYPIVLLWYWYEYGPQKPGRLRDFARRWHPKYAMIAIGAMFHVGLAIGLELGIFPWAMLAVYPAFFHPDELGAFGRLLGLDRLGRPAATPVTR
jgi:hypothetical protein